MEVNVFFYSVNSLFRELPNSVNPNKEEVFPVYVGNDSLRMSPVFSPEFSFNFFFVESTSLLSTSVSSFYKLSSSTDNSHDRGAPSNSGEPPNISYS